MSNPIGSSERNHHRAGKIASSRPWRSGLLRRIGFTSTLALALLGMAVQSEASCLAPNLEVEIQSVSLSSDGTQSAVLHLFDPNAAGLVTGQNIYRSSDPAAPAPGWSLLALNASDEDASTGLVDWTDPSPDDSPTGIWYYLAAAYNGPCDSEGPWMTPSMDDRDADGVPDEDDRCPTTPAGGTPVLYGCSVTDFLVRPDVLVRPVADGVEEILAENAAVGMPPEVETNLNDAISALFEVYDQLREATPCDASGSFNLVVGFVDAALLAIDDHLLTLGGAAAGAASGGAGPFDGTEGPTDWPSPEYLYWMGQRYKLSLLTGPAADGAGAALQTCNAQGPTTSVAGRVRSISDGERLVRLNSGERIVIAGNVVLLGGGDFMRDHEVIAHGNGYGNITVATSFETSPSPFPFIGGLNYDGCLQARVVPIQPLVNFPYRDNSWILHPFDGYRETGKLELEKGTYFMAEDLGCPGVIPGGGPGGVDLKLEYFYELKLDYFPRQGSFVNDWILSYELDGDSFPVWIPDMNPGSTGAIVAKKFKRTCLRGALDEPVMDGQGNFTFKPSWDCAPPQVVGVPENIQTRVRDFGAYCNANYQTTSFQIEDDQTQVHGVTSVIAVTHPAEVPNPVNFSAIGKKMQGSTPGPAQLLGIGDDFAIYNPFGPPSAGFGTNRASHLDWPLITGTRSGSPFRYTCSVPRLVTDVIDSCPSPSYYRLPFPNTYLTKVNQGNFGSTSHTGWQDYALDLDAAEGHFLTAARGGKVIQVRSDMVLTCKINTGEDCYDSGICTDTGPPLWDEFGNHVAIQHQDGTIAWYAHMQPFTATVSVNQDVMRGELIGNVGNTGFSCGPHVHFHVSPEDPARWGDTTVSLRYEAFDVQQSQTRSCFIPAEGQYYISTN